MDFKNIFCRLCAELHPDYSLLEITDDKAVNMNLASKIMQCYNVKITIDDILPKHVCENCCDKVINAFEFHELVQKSQDFLTKHMIQIQVKQENVDNVCSNNGLYDDDYGDDFPTDPKMENNSNDLNSDDEKPLSTLKESQNTLSTRRDCISKDDVECTVKDIKKEKDEEKWKCIECNIYLSSHKAYRNHYLNVHKKEAEYPCTECPKKYDKYGSFMGHKRVHINVNNGRFICKICCKICQDGAMLKRHMQTHSALTPYSCNKCNKSFKDKLNLQRHQNVHLPEGVKKKKILYRCKLCPKSFTNQEKLNLHKENHNPGEPVKNYVCDQCGSNFIHARHLKEHMLTHSNIFPFRCDKCPKAFKIVNKLNRHQKCHMDEQPFKCDVCLRPFRHKRALKRHATIHTNQLPFECEYCHKCFREKSYLKIHLRQHTGERPYSCLECNHFFTDLPNFIKHLKGRHGLQNVSVANQRQYPFINTKTDEQS